MNVQSLLGMILLSLAPGVAFAGIPTPISEPGVFELLAIGTVAAVVVAIRKLRK
jgi:hypothetical protein